MNRFVYIRLWLMVIIVVSIPIAFTAGIIFGVAVDVETGTGLYLKIEQAIHSGESRVIGNLVITPDKQWTSENPVSYIWLRNKKFTKPTAKEGGKQYANSGI